MTQDQFEQAKPLMEDMNNINALLKHGVTNILISDTTYLHRYSDVSGFKVELTMNEARILKLTIQRILQDRYTKVSQELINIK